MSILEGLGPKRKVFEDLEPGDYMFEVGEPGESGWTRRFYTRDEDGNDVLDSYTDNINWRLRVVQPEEFAGKTFFHSTMYGASPAKIAMAKRSYDPAGFTYQFFAGIGAATMQNGEAILLDDFLTDGEPDLNKMIGLRFHATIRKGLNPKQPDRVGLDKAWPEE